MTHSTEDLARIAARASERHRSEVAELLAPFRETVSSPLPAKMKDFAERYADAWCSQEPTRVAAFFSKEGSLSVNEGAPSVGREAIAAEARGFMEAFPDMRVLLDDLFVHEDRALFCWTLIGTNTGPGGKGRSVRISGFEAWRMSPQGFVGKSRGFFDDVVYARQLEHGVEGE